MQSVPIQAVPQQTLSYIDPSGNQWNISITLVGSQMAFTLTLNNTVLVENITAVAGYRIIPYNYLENGNFVLITQNKQIPDYTQFGITQQLIFLTQAEIDAYRVPLNTLSLITASDFDSNGGLPLRFAPVGYVLV